jgi:hypothetical protein
LYCCYNFLLVEKNTQEISTKTTITHLYVKTHMETLNTQHTMRNVQKDHTTFISWTTSSQPYNRYINVLKYYFHVKNSKKTWIVASGSLIWHVCQMEGFHCWKIMDKTSKSLNKAIGSKWVFTIKLKGNGSMDKYKT